MIFLDAEALVLGLQLNKAKSNFSYLSEDLLKKRNFFTKKKWALNDKLKSILITHKKRLYKKKQKIAFDKYLYFYCVFSSAYNSIIFCL